MDIARLLLLLVFPAILYIIYNSNEEETSKIESTRKIDSTSSPVEESGDSLYMSEDFNIDDLISASRREQK